MKANKAEKYRALSKEELEKELSDTKSKLFALKCQKIVGGGIPNFHKIREFRRDIAKILTVSNANNKVSKS